MIIISRFKKLILILKLLPLKWEKVTFIHIILCFSTCCAWIEW